MIWRENPLFSETSIYSKTDFLEPGLAKPFLNDGWREISNHFFNLKNWNHKTETTNKKWLARPLNSHHRSLEKAGLINGPSNKLYPWIEKNTIWYPKHPLQNAYLSAGFLQHHDMKIKINMEPTNHLLARNMIFQTSMIVFHVNLHLVP